MVKMLDLAGLPKNTNGFRTTHTCELCGFEPKTKNKYREKQDHLVMKHFKEKIDKIFPHCRPYTCPSGGKTLILDSFKFWQHFTDFTILLHSKNYSCLQPKPQPHI